MLLSFVTFALASTPPASINKPVETQTVEIPEGTETAQVRFDSRMPAEIRVDGFTIGQLYIKGSITTELPVGVHEVLVLTNGRPRPITIKANKGVTNVVFIGRTGISTESELTPLAETNGLANVSFRVSGGEDVLVQIGSERYIVRAHGTRRIEIPLGRHHISIRNGAGTVVWASGSLELGSATEVIMQLAEGRLPEVNGVNSAFYSGG